jgi:hypothetical protein
LQAKLWHADPDRHDHAHFGFLNSKSSAGMLWFLIRKRWVQYAGLFMILGLGIVLPSSLGSVLLKQRLGKQTCRFDPEPCGPSQSGMCFTPIDFPFICSIMHDMDARQG